MKNYSLKFKIIFFAVIFFGVLLLPKISWAAYGRILSAFDFADYY